MNYSETCPCCKRQISAYTLPLNRGLARAFLKFADARIRLGRAVEKGELALTNSEYGNFQNLRHFGIVAQKEKGRAWDFTPTGIGFLNGGALLSPCAHFGGETLPDDHLAWSTHDKPRAVVTLASILPVEWKQRAEYRDEKRGAA